jgi:hypothetical protein
MLLVFSVFTHQDHHEDHMFNASICSPSLVDDINAMPLAYGNMIIKKSSVNEYHNLRDLNGLIPSH